MAVKVRYRARDLMPPEDEVFVDATGYTVTDDNTLVLYGPDDEEYAIVHPDRWDSAVILEDA